MENQETTGFVGQEKTDEPREEHKLLFQSVSNVVLPSSHNVPLHGLQKLPKRFLQISPYLREEFRFQIQPSRIISENGILVSCKVFCISFVKLQAIIIIIGLFQEC